MREAEAKFNGLPAERGWFQGTNWIAVRGTMSDRATAGSTEHTIQSGEYEGDIS